MKKEKQLKKIKKNWYFNEMWYKIDNLMWNVLKIKYVKKKKKKRKFLWYNRYGLLHELMQIKLV